MISYLFQIIKHFHWERGLETIWENIEIFALFFARTASFIFVLPILGNRSAPLIAKIGLAVFISIFMLSVMRGVGRSLPKQVLPFFLMVGKEVLVGLALGFVTQFLFIGVQLAGEAVGMQMGFGIVRVMDPGFQAQLSIISEFQLLVVLLIYLSIDGHHFLLNGFAQSYQIIPIAKPLAGFGIMKHVVSMAYGIFESAVKIGGPVIVALLLTNMAMGFLARTVPQMNIFIVGFPLRIGVGLLALAFTITLFLHVFRNLWSHFQRDFVAFIELFV